MKGSLLFCIYSLQFVILSGTIFYGFISLAYYVSFFFFFLAGTLFYVNSDFVCVLSILTKLHLCSSISQCNLMCVVKENFITLTLKIFWALERSPNKYYEQREPTQKKYRCNHTKNYMVRQQPMSTGDNKEISLTNLV